jgi:hypothetical protein
MKDAFSELEGIWSRSIENDRKYMFEEILDLLKEQGKPIRQDDGELRQITLSKPKSVSSGFVIGLRYVKRDGTQAEDLCTVEKGRPIECYYKGRLQQKWPEYRGTHKQKVVFTKTANGPAPTTPVNTMSLVRRTSNEAAR